MLTRGHKDEGAGARDADPHFSLNSPPDSGADSANVKRLATVTARLALAGFSLEPLAAGGFLVFRWNLSQVLPDLPAVEQFYKGVAS